MESILSPEMRVKLTSDRSTNSTIRKLYHHYDNFPINITDNFETPQRHVIHPRVSFHSESGHREFNETSASRHLIQSIQSTPRNISSIREPRLSVASTSNITMSRGAPRPSVRRSLAAPSPTPFEESARTLNSLVEPAEGEYQLNTPFITEQTSIHLEPEKPGMRQRDRIHEQEQSRIEQSITRSPTIVTPAVTQRATVSLTLRETSIPSRVTPIVTPTRTPVARNHTPSLVPYA
jgi:hypothetical protein